MSFNDTTGMQNPIFKMMLEDEKMKVMEKNHSQNNLMQMNNNNSIEINNFNNPMGINNNIQIGINNVNSAFDNKIKNNNTINDNKIKEITSNGLSIICPLCGYDSILDLNDFKFELGGCRKGHQIYNIPFHDFLCKYNEIFEDFYKDRIMKCYYCEKSFLNSDMVFCKYCNMYCCSSFECIHFKYISDCISWNKQKCQCAKHGERHVFYCKTCNVDLCDLCEEEHEDNHNIIKYKDIFNKNNYQNKLEELKKTIDSLQVRGKEIIEDIQNKIDNVILNLQKFYEKGNNYIKNYDPKNKNYQILKNFEQINNISEKIMRHIHSYFTIENFTTLYDKMNKNNFEINNSNGFCENLQHFIYFKVDNSSFTTPLNCFFEMKDELENIENKTILERLSKYDLFNKLDNEKINYLNYIRTKSLLFRNIKEPSKISFFLDPLLFLPIFNPMTSCRLIKVPEYILHEIYIILKEAYNRDKDLFDGLNSKILRLNNNKNDSNQEFIVGFEDIFNKNFDHYLNGLTNIEGNINYLEKFFEELNSKINGNYNFNMFSDYLNSKFTNIGKNEKNKKNIIVNTDFDNYFKYYSITNFNNALNNILHGNLNINFNNPDEYINEIDFNVIYSKYIIYKINNEFYFDEKNLDIEEPKLNIIFDISKISKIKFKIKLDLLGFKRNELNDEFVINISVQDKLENIFSKFEEKSGIKASDCDFIFNCRKINDKNKLSLTDLDLKDCAKILVISDKNFGEIIDLENKIKEYLIKITFNGSIENEVYISNIDKSKILSMIKNSKYASHININNFYSKLLDKNDLISKLIIYSKIKPKCYKKRKEYLYFLSERKLNDYNKNIDSLGLSENTNIFVSDNDNYVCIYFINNNTKEKYHIFILLHKLISDLIIEFETKYKLNNKYISYYELEENDLKVINKNLMIYEIFNAGIQTIYFKIPFNQMCLMNNI